MNNDWEPDESAKRWAQSLVNKLKDGGIWIVEATGARYVLNKTAKTLTLTNGITDHPHERNVKAFDAIGYKVVIESTDELDKYFT
jgi:hypothetical protein